MMLSFLGMIYDSDNYTELYRLLQNHPLPASAVLRRDRKGLMTVGTLKRR